VTARAGGAPRTDETPAIEVEGVTKRFGTHGALDDVSLAVAPGLFVTLLGPSGCGKSTLLRAVAGFVIPDAGRLRIGGRDMTREPPHRRPVSMVFQDYALFPHMTVRENIGFGCEMKGMSRAEIARRCAELLELIRLPEVGGRLPEALSGGQRQRVALARALAPDPVSLLLDEPLGALDLKLRLEMQQELKAIQRRTGKTFVFVTHDQDEALSMSDRVAVMRAGRIEQIDAPERLYARPATAFVAGFVGAANMIAMQVEETGAQLACSPVAAPGLRWVLPAAAVSSAEAPRRGGAALMVVRPEALRVGPPPAEGFPSIEAEVVERTFFGGRVHLRLRGPGGMTLVAEARPQDSPAPGEVVTCHALPDEIALIAGDAAAPVPPPARPQT
jgi:spermidine/putrescine transport system ATP-binding protein